MTKKTLIFVALSASIVAIAFAEGDVSLPNTGQTTSYATGDDGELQKGLAWPVPRFTDNGDGTVTDNLTGLMWVKDGNLMTTRDPTFDNDDPTNNGSVTWQHALDYVALLNSGNYASHTDWRLPNRKELRSLVNYGQTNQATWLNGQGFSGVQAGYYWSSTTWTLNTTSAWIVVMSDGIMYYPAKAVPSYVLAVRAGQ